jgi:hypothetical protein
VNFTQTNYHLNEGVNVEMNTPKEWNMRNALYICAVISQVMELFHRGFDEFFAGSVATTRV